MEVSFKVLPGCNVTAQSLAFAARAGSGAEAEASIDVTCSAESGVQVSLDNGRNASDGVRRMASTTGAMVPYEIYQDAGRTRRWQNVAVRSVAGPDAPLRIIAFGRIEPDGSAVPVGEYRDSVTVTVAF
ncbi:hypothetical protein GCM10011515_06240 [Tsuneonella deserti]|uniref:Spore coat protein U/FanG domain-containing protein n=2 Tax=Tsuneonella deserti TaxID=2035528 RepID=A0ABQ1S2S7_9SPHN|nr:hypothetical protein GCM10011515_06240 [Tsuneonella deserti]